MSGDLIVVSKTLRSIKSSQDMTQIWSIGVRILRASGALISVMFEHSSDSCLWGCSASVVMSQRWLLAFLKKLQARHRGFICELDAILWARHVGYILLRKCLYVLFIAVYCGKIHAFLVHYKKYRMRLEIALCLTAFNAIRDALNKWYIAV